MSLAVYKAPLTSERRNLDFSARFGPQSSKIDVDETDKT